MALPASLVLGLHTLATLQSPQEAGAIKDSPNTADHTGSYGPAFYQSHSASGQFTYEFDGEQLFSVDLKKSEAMWRLPEFGNFAHFDPQGGPASLAMIRAHLDVLVERSNRARAPSGTWPSLSPPVPPRVTVLPKSQVELGHPNVLICIVDNIFPPVINITWLRNGQTVTQEVAQSSFYSQPDHSFHEFHYLACVPSPEDAYDRRVEHWGLDKPLLRHWEPQVPNPPPGATETLLCAPGLAVGLAGFLVDTALVITGTRLSSAPGYRSPSSLGGGGGQWTTLSRAGVEEQRFCGEQRVLMAGLLG
ncbi:HLA class II histocompatibility antigen, DO alpha chain [Microcebus murinus]|uniref:HLA class II histocompatibility antigen, DO alpha chain n=1 Tax=Microcebus murinus TaxID=30608 RepID=UPI003F6BA7A7